MLVGILGTGCRKAPRKSAVCEVQGTGLESPYLDQEVILSGLVIADLEGAEPGGFMILDEACPLDGEASRGLYISLGAGQDLVDLGDQVQVRGTVRESGGETYLEADLPGLEILSMNNPLPGPADLADYLIPPMVFGYEKWEGQLVAIPRADLVESRALPARFLAVPQISPDPAAQLICFQEESFSLGINGDLLGFDPGLLQPEYRLEDLVGLIRQDQDGYYLQLLEKPSLRLIDQNPQGGGYFPQEPVFYAENIPIPTKTPTVAPTPTPGLAFRPSWTSSPTIIPSPTYYPVRLLITELLPNPLGEEPGGEWVELFNPGGEKLPLNGIKIGDEISPGGKEGLLRFPPGNFIESGQVLVIANQSRVFQPRYGFLPDFELVDSDPRVPDMLPYDPWGKNSVKLSNTGDEVLLVDPWDQVVDLVVYGKSGAGGFSPPAPAPAEGHSLERYPPEQDRDQAGDWRERSSPSPGRLDRSPPTMPATPTYPPSPSPTFSLTPGSPSATPSPWTVLPSLVPSCTSTPILQSTSTPTQSETASPTLTCTWPSSLTPSLTASVTTTPTPSPTPTPAPILSATLCPDPTGISTSSPEPTMEETWSSPPPATNSSTGTVASTNTSTMYPATTSPTGTAQCTPSSTETPSGLMTFTPEPTLTFTPGPAIIINEILADPDPVLGDSNGDGQVSWDDDEFLELVNVSGKVLDLSGWQVWDEIRLRYTFPEGTTLGSGCGLVLFGGGQPSGAFGGSQIFTAGSLGLNNAGDLVTIKDSEGLVVAWVSFGPEGNQNQSLTRNPDLSGPLPLVLHSQVPEAGGALYSPGTKLDLTGFGGCP